MKKIVAFLLFLSILVSCAPLGFADDYEYIALSDGSTGAQVTMLQRRLTLLGFYAGEIDGGYGPKTAEAVYAFETYLAEVERMEYEGIIMDEIPEDTMSTHELEETPPPDEPFSPSFVPDGIAEPELLAILYDDDIDLFITEVSQGSKNEDAWRVQRRLYVLNYISDRADGSFGLNSVAALKKFQREHDLPATGVTDGQTRQLLYSDQAVRSARPVHSQLRQGMEGDVVRAIQERLWVLGFSISKPDGKYGNGTVRSVNNLQNYIYALDHADYKILTWQEGDDEDVVTTGIQGYTPTGIADPELIELMLEGTFPVYRETLEPGSVNIQEIMRLQRRLFALIFMAGTNPADGEYGKNTESAVVEFQARNGLPETGIADEATQRALFSPDAIPALKPYLIKVSTEKQRVYVYKPDDNEDYTILFKTFICSTGKDVTPTPLGTFPYTSPSTNEWHYFAEFKSWAHWPFYIHGDIMFHSVLFNKQDDPKSLQTSTRKNLGKKASHGCIRLEIEDAKWIYDNCPKRTTVIIY